MHIYCHWSLLYIYSQAHIDQVHHLLWGLLWYINVSKISVPGRLFACAYLQDEEMNQHQK